MNEYFRVFFMKFREFKELVKSDLFRYTGKLDVFCFLRYYFFGRGFHYTFWMRLTTYFYRKPYFKMFYIFSRINLYRLSTKYGIEISHKVQVGKGLYIGHFGCIVVSNEAVIGDNVNLSQGVTVGQSNTGSSVGSPVIGSEVYIGPGAKIFGKITIGHRCAIGANCVVSKSLDQYSVVVGVPGEVISKKGSRDYIQNKWDL